MTPTPDAVVAAVKLLMVELGLVFTEDADYHAAVELGVRAYEAGRAMAAGDIAADAERYPSAAVAPVRSALGHAAKVAAEGSAVAPEVPCEKGDI